MPKTVLLIHPPPYLHEGTDPFGPVNDIVPIGLYAIAEYLRARGRPVVLARLGRQGAAGSSWDGLLAALVGRHAPGVIAVQAHWSFYAEGAAEVVRRLRRITQSSLLVMGGVHASSLAAALLEELPELDAVVVGEGEGPLAEIVERDAVGGIAGVMARGGAFRPAAPLGTADLPVLRFDPDLLDPPDHARFIGVPVVRGACPKPCSYCELNNRAIFRRKQGILEPILDEQIRRAAEASVPLYLPENFVGERALLRLLGRVGEGGRLGPVYVDCHPDMLSDAVLDALGALAASGVRLRLWLGIESGSRAVRERAGRRYDAARIAIIRDRLLAAGIRPTASVLVGLPGEGPLELMETSGWLRGWNDAGLLADVFPALAFPGTALYRNPGQYGLTLHFRKARDFERLSRSWFAPLSEDALPQENGLLSPREVLAAVLRLRLEQRARLRLPVTHEVLTLMGHPAASPSPAQLRQALDQVASIWPLDLPMPVVLEEESA